MPSAPSAPTSDSLASLEAQIESLQDSKENALARLAGQTEPASVRRRIAILIELRRFADAVDELRRLEPAEFWIDIGALAFAASGCDAEAKRCVAWARAQNDPALAPRTAVMYMDGMMDFAFKDKVGGATLTPGNLSEQEEFLLRTIVEVVAPVCDYVASRGSVATEVQSQMLQRYFDVLFLLGERTKASTILELLLTRDPIPIRSGLAMLQGFGSASTEIVNRLWDEHPDSFRARFIASLLLARRLNDATAAKERALSITALAKSNDQREELCELLYELCELEDAEAVADVIRFSTRILGPDSRLLVYFRAHQLMRAGKTLEAVALLENIRDEADPRWLRTYAAAKGEQGEHGEAVELLKRLGSVAPSPEVFRKIGALSSLQGRIEDEIAALEQTLAMDSADVSARRRLAMVPVDSKRYSEAAKHLEVLRDLQPEDETVVANLAITYCFEGDLDKALATLTLPRKEAAIPYLLLKTRAQILQATGRVHEAFDELAKGKSEHWDEPEFVVGYMELAYAAGRDVEANEALIKLQSLHELGRVDERLMRPASLEDVKEWMEGAARRHDEIRRMLLTGMMTWISAAELQGEVPLWSWILKTQRLNWIWDDPLNRAMYAVYATNSFRVFQEGDGSSILEPIVPPPKGVPVVVDLSALITLHELGLLTKVVQYFGTLIVPTTYLARVFNDTRKLLPHQRSQKQAAEAIVSSVRDGRITVLAEGDSGGVGAQVDEYVEQEKGGRPVLRLSNLIDFLHQEGLLTDREREQAKSAAHRAPTVTEGELAVSKGMRLSISGLTLVTLHGMGLLDLVAREFSVYIPSHDYNEATGRVRAFQALEEARTKHGVLWSALRSNGGVRFTSTKTDLQLDDKNSSSQDVGLTALHLARERNLPLLVDDRVSQAVILNERKEMPAAAFGSDSLIKAMFEDGYIEASECADFLLQLMKWRYRFILMPPEAMKVLASRYISHPPGDALRQVARYIHDCMRDQGLFGGLEATTPPSSIAIRLYQSWAQHVGELLIEIWSDPKFSESYAQEFTEWAIAELLPSPPRVLDQRMQSTVASLTGLAVMTTAMLEGANSKERQRINQGLRSMAAALGLNETEYVDTIARLSNATNR